MGGNIYMHIIENFRHTYIRTHREATTEACALADKCCSAAYAVASNTSSRGEPPTHTHTEKSTVRGTKPCGGPTSLPSESSLT